MATYKVIIDSHQLFDQHGAPAAARSIQDARHKMIASRFASHRATAAFTSQTLMDTFIK